VHLDPHCGAQADAVDIGAQGLSCSGLARHRIPEGQHPLTGARPEGDPVPSGAPSDRQRVTAGCTTGRTGVTSSGCPARSTRSDIANDGTRCCTSTCGMMRSTEFAEARDMRRAPHDAQRG
jgi:hypothetical protein